MIAGRTRRVAGMLATAMLIAQFPVPAKASAKTRASYSHALEAAHDIVHRLMADNGIPGLAITIMIDRKVLWSSGEGLADLEHQLPVTLRTRMRIGSISKSLTAAAAASLAEKGAINLDESVRQYLPELPEQYAAVTLKEIGGHLSGIRSYRLAGEEINYRHYGTVMDALPLFVDDPLQSPSGTKYLYSGYGFILLSAALERATHLTFDDVMSTYLWTPLNMQHTGFDDVVKIIPDRTRQYQRTPQGEPINAAFSDDSYKKAGSGMLSTAPDLATFGAALLDDSYLTERFRSLLFASQTTASGERTGYGFGWFVDMEKFLDDHRSAISSELYAHLKSISHDRRLVWHNGTASGATAMLLLAPDSKVVVAVICNLGGVEAQIIAATMEIESAVSNAVIRNER
jgi:serine beta-lactamase-like protein LACTB